MEFEHEQRHARRILDGVENGTMTAHESWTLIEQSDPTLVYFLLTYLREKYAGHPASEAVVGRIIAILTAHPEAARMMKEGEGDSLVEWFEDNYEYRNLGAEEFVRIVVEKLES